MKKFVLAVMAVAAIGFTASCGNKTQQGARIDTVAVIDSIASGAAQEDIDAISGILASKDAAKLQEALAAVKEKIASFIKENPEVAKEYVTKVQEFLKENEEQVKAVVGDNAAVAAAVSAVTEIEPEAVVSGLLEQVGDAPRLLLTRRWRTPRMLPSRRPTRLSTTLLLLPRRSSVSKITIL